MDDTTTTPEELTDAELVALLKSDDSKDRAKALSTLYPDQSAVVIRTSGTGMDLAHTAYPNMAMLLSATLWAASLEAQALGMTLALATAPSQPAPGQLVVPQGGGFK
jgi:hypothetical protein